MENERRCAKCGKSLELKVHHSVKINGVEYRFCPSCYIEFTKGGLSKGYAKPISQLLKSFVMIIGGILMILVAILILRVALNLLGIRI